MSTPSRLRRRLQSGQVAVESAIVLPFFLFFIFGLLQLGLCHQARLMTKYAAYKAARVGAIHSADVDLMEHAALGVLLPFAGRGDPKYEHVFKAGSSGDYVSSWGEAKSNNQPATNHKYAEVTICNPTSKNDPGDKDFDDMENWSEDDWQGFEKFRLNVQVTFYYRLIIPFANGVLWYMVVGEEDKELLRVLRSGDPAWNVQAKHPGGEWTVQELKSAAQAHYYVLPIRASYGMHMQSNFLQQHGKPPGSNKCHIPWKKQGS